MGVKADMRVVPSLKNLELTQVSSFGGHGGGNKHFHEKLSFAVVTEGFGEFQFKNYAQKVTKGAIIKIPPGEVHSSGKSSKDRQLEYRVFYLSNASINDILNAEEHKSEMEIQFKEQISYDRNFYLSCLNAHYKLFVDNDSFMLESIFTQLVLDLIKKHSCLDFRLPVIDLRPTYLPTIIDYLHANYTSKISLNQLSIISAKSPSQILRTFQKHIGIAPHAYLINLRVIKAKKLLIQGMSITQAALEVGFTDQSHLHRYFQRITHVTPRLFSRAKYV
jgi:AraC-like DNA-binding protein